MFGVLALFSAMVGLDGIQPAFSRELEQVCQKIVVYDKEVIHDVHLLVSHIHDVSAGVYTFDRPTFMRFALFDSWYQNSPSDHTLCHDFMIAVVPAKALEVILAVANVMNGKSTRMIGILGRETYENAVLLENDIYFGSLRLLHNNGTLQKAKNQIGSNNDSDRCSSSFKHCHLKIVFPKILDDSWKYLESYAKNVFEILAQRRNISSTFVHDSSGSWGVQIEGGNFSGVIGYLQRREAHLSTADFAFLHNRNKVATYCPVSKFLGGPRIVSLSPQKKLPSIESFLFVFDQTSWILMLISVFVGAFFLTILSRRVTSLSMINVLKGLTQQGTFNSSYKSRSKSWTIFFAIWLLCSNLLSVMYASIFLSIILAPNYEETIETLDQVHDKGLKIIVQQESAHEAIILNDYPQLIPQVVWKEFINVDMLMQQEDKLAIISSSVEKGKCSKNSNRFHMSQNPLVDKLMELHCWITLKNAPWEETLNLLTLRLNEAGLFVREIIRAQRENYAWNECSTPENHLRRLSVRDISFAFIIIGSGLAVSVLVFVLERISFKLKSTGEEK